ncbi:signal peptidase I [Leptospira kobayashii]|uniref:Signal peptidase I n=1 Tax=Leptospira kobayashii TaxID=1917830 RepID=A0ABM7ULS6_9LEPT|nr:signal peptidase I [Leptospira kobayashii]BDA79833.1 signal peptidase I [Leptospira kobayashii]
MGIFSSKTKPNPPKTKKEEPQEGIFASSFSFAFIVVLVFAFKSSILDANNIPSGSMIPTLKIGDFLFVNKMRYSIRMPFTEKEIFRIDDPKRGDIVTFIPPATALAQEESRTGIFAKRFVKRVVGLPGDTIRITRKFVDTKDRGRVHFAYFEYKPKDGAEFLSYSPREVPIGDELSDLDNIDASQRALFVEQKPGFEHYILEGFEDDRRAHIFECCDFVKGHLIPEGQYMVMGDNRDDSHDSRAWGFVGREDILGKALVIYFSIDWKDFTCEYKSGKELAEKGAEFAERYQGEELEKKCHPSEVFSSSSYRYREEETRFGWIERTLKYRLWRLNVRWDRVGRILN